MTLWSPKGSHSLPSAPRHKRTGLLLLAHETRQTSVSGVTQGFQNERHLYSTPRPSWKTPLAALSVPLPWSPATSFVSIWITVCFLLSRAGNLGETNINVVYLSRSLDRLTL